MTLLSIHEIDQFLKRIPPHLGDIVLELRNLVAEVAPDAVEIILWKGLTYYHAGRGGPVSAGICQIGLQPDHIRLAFIHGAFLPDPKNLLVGDPKYKRYIRLESFDLAPWDDLRDLITASSRFDPYTQSMDESAKDGS